MSRSLSRRAFFFNEAATPEIYPLSLHDALPICSGRRSGKGRGKVGLAHQVEIDTPCGGAALGNRPDDQRLAARGVDRSEEHTSELQSQFHLVCRLLLEKKKQTMTAIAVYKAPIT